MPEGEAAGDAAHFGGKRKWGQGFLLFAWFGFEVGLAGHPTQFRLVEPVALLPHSPGTGLTGVHHYTCGGRGFHSLFYKASIGHC